MKIKINKQAILEEALLQEDQAKIYSPIPDNIITQQFVNRTTVDPYTMSQIAKNGAFGSKADIDHMKGNLQDHAVKDYTSHMNDMKTFGKNFGFDVQHQTPVKTLNNAFSDKNIDNSMNSISNNALDSMRKAYDPKWNEYLKGLQIKSNTTLQNQDKLQPLEYNKLYDPDKQRDFLDGIELS
jgi:hypothetical protein